MSHIFSLFMLLGGLCICATVEAHIDIDVTACKTNDTDPEEMAELDGDEMLYIDFKKNEVVITLPEFADQWTAEGWAQRAEADHQTCLSDLKMLIEAGSSPPEQIDAPQLTIYTRNEVELGKNNILICFVNNFYPPPVKVKWTKNNMEVKEGVTLSRYYPNSDFSFRQYSTLQFTPQKGDDYSCTVYHQGLTEPETRFWEPEFRDESDIGKTAFCGIGLTLGLLGVGAGTFFLVKGNNCS
uniref:H-2 class II histocompatibility antigen, A-U alpha chain-like n=1 Tax=Paramormyrops kingsleyae TaxID=1676925 RepID=A0A3B3T067_9TELE|nr:H-2 class II histocompatibility antigen, A-U alpha chain-like isoform X2 [Paramormyrops kingsleyae]